MDKILLDVSATAEAKATALLDQMTDDEKFTLTVGLITESKYVGHTSGIPRLGIPDINNNDGPAGFRTQIDQGTSTTAFPSALSLASSWDPNLNYEWASTDAKEFRGKGA